MSKSKTLKDKDLMILDVNKPRSDFIEIHKNLPLIPAIVLFISPPASGKSLLLLNFIYRFYTDIFNEVYWFSPTLNLDNTLDTSVKKDETIIKICEAKDLLQINSFLKIIVETQEKLEKENKKLENILVVLDDCVSFINGKSLLETCTVFRHLRITLWISIQKMKLLNNTIRTCATDVITFEIPNQKQKAYFFEEFGCFPDIEKYYEICTKEKYNWMRLRMKPREIFHGGPNGIVKIWDRETNDNERK